MKGHLAIVLHSHLPYVLTHGVWPHGADWLNECCAETYIPILDVCYRLVSEGISPKFTIGLTPVLCEQLADPAFAGAFRTYVNHKIESAVLNADEFRRTGQGKRASLAEMWRDYYIGTKRAFLEIYDKDIVAAFRKLQDEGHIEIITSAATHGYLPLLGEDTAINAQIKLGAATYEKRYGRHPRGIWLPECAYRPGYEWTPPVEGFGNARHRKGIEEFLSENGIEYFVVDSHMLKGGEAVGVYLDRFSSLKQLWKNFEEQYRPMKEDMEKSPHKLYYAASVEGKAPVAFFTRDPETGLQVWSGEYGYPGNLWRQNSQQNDAHLFQRERPG